MDIDSPSKTAVELMNNISMMGYNGVVIGYFLLRTPDMGLVNITTFERVKFEAHRHSLSDYTVVVYHGKLSIYRNGKVFTLNPGDCHKVPSDTIHEVIAEEGTRYHMSIIPLTAIEMPSVKIIDAEGNVIRDSGEPWVIDPNGTISIYS